MERNYVTVGKTLVHCHPMYTVLFINMPLPPSEGVIESGDTSACYRRTLWSLETSFQLPRTETADNQLQ